MRDSGSKGTGVAVANGDGGGPGDDEMPVATPAVGDTAAVTEPVAIVSVAGSGSKHPLTSHSRPSSATPGVPLHIQAARVRVLPCIVAAPALRVDGGEL